MARLKIAKVLYATAVLAMPLSYALKDLFGLVGITWIDPTLVLGLMIFLLIGFPIKERSLVWLLVFAFVSAFIGTWLLRASFDREHTALYTYYVEPIRLTLNVIWFWVSLRFFRFDSKFVLRWLSLCVAWEFAIASYLYAALYDAVPVPDTVKLYLYFFKTRQGLSLNNWEIYRMAGTFLESPPFGLFMFCCLVIFILALISPPRNASRRFRALLIVGATLSFAGTVASLSDQMLIALFAFCLVLLFAYGGRTRAASKLLGVTVVIVLAVYVGNALTQKTKSEAVFSGDPMGTSIGERSFHARYGLSLLTEQPIALATGIGPGRYGDYAVRTGFFPSSVTTQFTLIDWTVEYGLAGLFLVGVWLFRIGGRAALSYGIVGVGALLALLFANMFQANWMWESWFLALAFLYGSVYSLAEVPTRASLNDCDRSAEQ